MKNPMVAALVIMGVTAGAIALTIPSVGRILGDRGHHPTTPISATGGQGGAAKHDSGPIVVPLVPPAPPPEISHVPVASAGEVPSLFPSKAADPAGATLFSDPMPGKTTETILRSIPAPRKTAVGFLKQTIPDPEDRASTPETLVTPDVMPIIPTPAK